MRELGINPEGPDEETKYLALLNEFEYGWLILPNMYSRLKRAPPSIDRMGCSFYNKL
jgi:hypothetical protein